jgi:hypothetical protein
MEALPGLRREHASCAPPPADPGRATGPPARQADPRPCGSAAPGSLSGAPRTRGLPQVRTTVRTGVAAVAGLLACDDGRPQIACTKGAGGTVCRLVSAPGAVTDICSWSELVGRR